MITCYLYTMKEGIAMFQKGEYIIYRNTGVCQVAEIGVPENFPITEGTLYYFLVPIRGSGTIYIPINSPVFMRPVLTREEADTLISSIPLLPELPTQYKDQKALVGTYKALVQTHDCSTLLQLIKSIRKKDSELTQKGKHLGKIDIQYRKQAEEMLCEEFSIALSIPFEEIPSYIQQKVDAIA